MSMSVPSSMDKEAIKRNAFHDQGILVVDINDDRIAWPEKEVLRQIGVKLFGQKRERRVPGKA